MHWADFLGAISETSKWGGHFVFANLINGMPSLSPNIMIFLKKVYNKLYYILKLEKKSCNTVEKIIGLTHNQIMINASEFFFRIRL